MYGSLNAFILGKWYIHLVIVTYFVLEKREIFLDEKQKLIYPTGECYNPNKISCRESNSIFSVYHVYLSTTKQNS